MFSTQQLLHFTKRLFPKGSAFKFRADGAVDKLLSGVAETNARCFTDVQSIYDSLMPDNANFTIEDAAAWEKKLGIVQAPGVGLHDRKAAIAQKLFYPTSYAPRQHHLFIQEQLRAAGFDVYVHLNPLGLSPEQILSPLPAVMHSDDLEHDNSVEHSGYALVSAQHSSSFEHGSAFQHGSTFDDVVVNHIDRDRDASYLFANNYRFTFYIAGSTMPDFAEVSSARKDEFRQLILQLKPIHTQAYLFVNYY